jgi:hypothetical protein
MSKRHRAHGIAELIKASDDPAAILGQIYRRFDLPDDHGPRPPKRRLADRRACAEVQADDLGVLCERTVSSWLFGPAPEARERLGPLLISDPAASEVLDDPRFRKSGLDDGTFQSDLVLMTLRRRFREALGAP